MSLDGDHSCCAGSSGPGCNESLPAPFGHTAAPIGHAYEPEAEAEPKPPSKPRDHSGGHLFATSPAGPWHNSPVPPYTSNITWSTGASSIGYRRERPYVILGEDGDPLYLFNGIDWDNGTNPFVMVQRVGPPGRKSDDNDDGVDIHDLRRAASVDQVDPCELFVSGRHGSDNHAGTSAAPLRSLQAAARVLRSGCAHDSGKHVWVAPDSVYEPLVLGIADSNTTWQSHGPALCEVSGAVPVNTMWSISKDTRLPDAARGSVLEAALTEAQASLLAPIGSGGSGRGGPLSTQPYTSLYYEGKEQQLARYPDIIDLDAYQAGPATNWSTIPKTGAGVVDACFEWPVGDDRPAAWVEAAARGDLTLHGMFFVLWKDTFADNITVNVTNRKLCRAGGFLDYGVAKGGVWYALNLVEELTQPGEYVLDRHTRKVFFWPPSASLDGIGPEVVRLTNATSVLSLSAGTSDVTFRGFAFRYSRGACVAAVDAHRFTLDRCEVTDAGGEGVSIGSTPGTDVRYSTPAGSHHRVTNSTIRNTGLAGVVMSCGDRKSLTSCGGLASDNSITDFGRHQYTYSAAVAVAGVGVTVANNRVKGGYHLALSCAGNGHQLERNVISDVCLETWDTGALYVGGDWSYYGSMFTDNLLYRIGRPGVACNSPTTSCERHFIYLDEWGTNDEFCIAREIVYTKRKTVYQKRGICIKNDEFCSFGLDHQWECTSERR